MLMAALARWLPDGQFAAAVGGRRAARLVDVDPAHLVFMIIAMAAWWFSRLALPPRVPVQ
jgi:hypothetical protein